MTTDKPGHFAAQFKPYHLSGLELRISVAILTGTAEPTGQCKMFADNTVATAKTNLMVGKKLDSEGGSMVYGKPMAAEDSLSIEGIPIGLAYGLVLKRVVKKDKGLSWQDIE